MNITIKDEQGRRRLRGLKAGDCFVRNAQKRPLVGRSVYMVLHYHSRLESFKTVAGDIIAVNLATGRLEHMTPDQHVLEINGGVEMEVVE